MNSLFAGDDEVADSQVPETMNKPAAAKANPKAVEGQQNGKDAMRFEDAFSRLEALVGEMERGELPLEQMLDRFEEGVKLVRHCNEFLSQAQLRVERYVEQKDGHWVLKEEKG